MAKLIKPTFGKGEISPQLHGRVDAAAYGSGLATARNAVVHTYGGISRRPGTRFVAPVNDHDYAPRLIPFEFKTTDQYILEFGDEYMRVIRNDAHVREADVNITGATRANPVVITAASHGYSNGDEVYITGVGGMVELNGKRFKVNNVAANTFELQDQVTSTNVNGTAFTAYTSGGTVARIYQISTPYAIEDVFEITYVQSADVMTLAHKDYAIRELTRTSHAAWTLTALSIGPSFAEPTGMAVSVASTRNRADRYTVTAIHRETDEESLAGLNNTSRTITGATQAEPVVITSASHGFSDGDEVEINSVVGMTQLNGNRYIVANAAANTFELTDEDGVDIDGTGYTAYSSGGTAQQTFVRLAASTATITAITAASPAVVTAAGHGFITGDKIEISGVVGMTEVNGNRYLVGAAEIDTFDLKDLNDNDVDATGYTAYSSGGTATIVETNDRENTVTWTGVANAGRYAVYRERNGLFGLIGETTQTTFTDDNITPDTEFAPPKFRNPFEEADDRPGAVGFYEQRRVFGGTDNSPDTYYFSQTGNHDNFNVSSPGQADDAITATLNDAQVNEIRHFVGQNDLIVLTSGSEWRVSSGPDSVFSFDTIRQKPQSRWGCALLRPITVGNTILFVTEDEANVRSLGYSYEIDGYTGTNLCVFSRHLTDGYSIEDWAYARLPDSRVYMVRSDGKALTMSYDQEQEVLAWTRMDTSGSFEAVASLRGGGTYSEDSVYFVVRRLVDGNTVRYIEVMRETFFDDVRDCFFVDSGLSLDDPKTITGISLANPVVITSASHGFSNGDYVDIFDVEWEPDTDEFGNDTQPDQLNGSRYVVASATANTFALTGEDGTSFNGYVSGGTARKAVSTITGLDHLEGRTVVALCDGNVVSGLTVENGGLTLPQRFSRVHAGLSYLTDIETLDIESGQGTIQGSLKKINKVIVRFYKSRGLFVGPDSTDLIEMKQRDPENMGDPTELLTGDREVYIPASWNRNGRVFMRQRDPLPLTILAVIPHLEVADD